MSDPLHGIKFGATLVFSIRFFSKHHMQPWSPALELIGSHANQSLEPLTSHL